MDLHKIAKFAKIKDTKFNGFTVFSLPKLAEFMLQRGIVTKDVTGSSSYKENTILFHTMVMMVIGPLLSNLKGNRTLIVGVGGFIYMYKRLRLQY